MRQSTTRSAGTVAVALAVTAISACGTQSARDGAGSPTSFLSASPSASASTTLVDLGSDVVAHGMLMQDTPDGPVELCLGGVAESYPPQCGGPTLVGEVDWSTLAPQRANGVTWTEGEVWAIGRFEPAGTAHSGGRLTLTRPLSLTPPAGVTSPTPPPMSFPQLCDDPYADGGSSSGGTDDAQNALMERLTSLDGYVGSWVSDGSSLFNVVVTGDADVARSALRATWKGGLCVEQRDQPTEADAACAQEAVTSVPGLLSAGYDATSGVLDVQVTVLDAPTRDRIVAAVSRWLDADQVRMSSAVQPLTS
ncbi:hypothetical protein [Knoellia sp. LjRoot47]|uniref:hypothetical protein n=1 Tax=Knoellia sp. LjRoot47 TaxID=3342330 RepID=UPI003ED0662C